jgi:hypothetical protein
MKTALAATAAELAGKPDFTGVKEYPPTPMRNMPVLIAVLLFLLSIQPSRAQVPTDQQSSRIVQFDMGPRYVHMPEKYFVLVRKGREIGAIQLTKIEQNTPSLGNSTYESYFQGDGSGSFLNSNVVRRSGEIDIKPLRVVFHSLMWQPGPNKLWVGKWWFGCLSPSLINMSSHFSEKDQGYEFAPTSARKVAEIDVSDKRLKWFRYDPDARITVPVSDLPK